MRSTAKNSMFGLLQPKKYRTTFAKFRCGVASKKIEAYRKELNRVPVNERLCETTMQSC